jgi:hypothetical protein
MACVFERRVRFDGGGAELRAGIKWKKSMWLRKRGDERSFGDHVNRERNFSDYVERREGNSSEKR